MKRVGTVFYIKENNRSPLCRIKCGRGDHVEFLYILGLMFFGVFGAVMLFYPLFSEIIRAAGGKFRHRTGGECSQRKNDNEK